LPLVGWVIQEGYLRITLLPKTTLGKWSLGIILAGILFYVLFFMVVRFGYRGGDTFGVKDVALASPMILAVVSAISSMVVGIISIIKSRERSILIFLATVVGLFAFMLVVGEFLSPH
jgi:hypothetical protein